MNRYENYCQTGIEWLGDIPSTWELSRVGKFFTERSQKVDDVSYPALSVTMSGIVDQLSDVAKTDDGDNRKLVKKDDFVINSRSDRKGSSGISPRDGSVSVINIVLEPSGINPEYSQYLFKSYYFKEEFFRNGKGIHWDLWSTRWEQFKNINIPVPSLKEQKIITDYLDKKTKKIDSLIEKIVKKIELLNESKASLINQCVTKGLNPHVLIKPSGIEFIEDIPNHWGLNRLKNNTKVINGFAFSSESFSKSEAVPVIRIGDVQTPLILEECVKLTSSFLETHKEFVIQQNDILVGMTGGTIGKNCVYDNATPSLLNQRVCIFRAKNKIDQGYLSDFISSFVFKHQIDFNAYGGGQPNIGKDDLMNFVMPTPPFDEQVKIHHFLKEKCSKINQIISNEKRRQLLIEEYRRSLIFFVVTGKVRIIEDTV
jgi:type I restriction enzyme S subunit